MAPPVEIAVPTTTTSTTSKPFTVFNISLRQPLRSYVIQKRYSDFVALHASITAQCDHQPPPASLPPKTWLKNTVSNPELAESRRQGLEAYLKAINEASDSRWRSCSAWRTFLNLPSSISTSGTTRSTLASDTASSTMDPGVWLDVHREVKAHLREAKQHVHGRGAASSPQKQHEESANAKQCLVRASTMLSALQTSLKIWRSEVEASKDKGPGGGGRLGLGEIRRRDDLINAAIRERDGLEQSLTAINISQDETATGGTATSTPDDREVLFKTANGSSGAARRVLGAPQKETERTRELDNAGVLQLQKQIMAEQDHDVGEITKTVQRMKQMGVQINDELQLQNEMLGLLDQDVDRVSDKINIAKKRMSKIK